MSVSISGAGSISGLDQGFNVTTGSVGVGTTNPRTDLQVGAFGGGDSNIQLATGTSGASNILFGDGSAGSDYYKGFIKYNHSTDNLELYTTDDLIHYTGGSERLRITSAGKVGINTDNPKQKLSVVGRVNIDNRGDYYGAWIDGDSNGSSSFNVGVWHNAGGRMRNEGSHLVLETQNTSHWVQLQPSGGNISVGSNNPNGLLALTASSGRILTLRNSTTGSASGDGSYLALNGSDLQISNAESANISLYTADTERLRIDSTGQVTLYDSPGIQLSAKASSLYSLDGALSYYATNNGVYLNGAGTNGWLRLNAGGVENNHNAINIFGGSAGAYISMHTSNNERVRIDSSGNANFKQKVSIGESYGGGEIFKLGKTSGTSYTGYYNGGTAHGFIGHASELVSGGSSTDFAIRAANNLVFATNGNNERLRISSSGKVGINYSNPSYMLEVQNPNPGNDSKQLIQRWINNSQNTLELHMYGGSIDQCQFATTNSEQTLSFLTGVATGNVDSTKTSLLLTQNRDAWLQGPDTSNYGGALFIGAEASPYGNLCALRDNNKRPLIYMGGQYPEITLAHTVASNTSHGPAIRFATYVQSTNTATGSQFVIGTNGSGTFLDIGHAAAGQNVNVHAGIANYAGTMRFRVTTSGCQVNGSLSKSSGSFRIDHPLAGLSTTRDLVHSFIEGPQADLIYRGVVDLVDGTATVNIDTAGRMTEGTFEVLCTNVSCFTSNETDWTAVKGSVSGNILTITAQDNTSTATVSWMVVGERKDPHMIDTDWTDENGRVITEPLKSS